MPDRHPQETLTLPAMSPSGLARHFGPGMILMMTGIGTSHLVTAPVAGGRFEYALLWCIPIAYVFKYYGFEMAFRFTHATGRSILDAYATAWRQMAIVVRPEHDLAPVCDRTGWQTRGRLPRRLLLLL